MTTPRLRSTSVHSPGIPWLGVLLLVPAAAGAQEHHGHSPYAELHHREIKALSAEEVEGLRRGEGMEMALPAELNGYPGPRHVLDLADELELGVSQRVRVEEIFEAMDTRARSLGSEIVELERELDEAFASRTITPEGLEGLADAIGARRARLRATHLRAHLALVPVLTDEQRARYAELRGYAGPAPG